MPSYLIHLAVAHKAAEKLFPNQEENANLFFCGALFPDAFKGKTKDDAHFYHFPDFGELFRNCDLDLFLNIYPNYRDNPFLFGYYVHLLTDQLFYHSFLEEFISISKKSGVKREGRQTEILLKKSGKAVKTEQFFSEDYLYGDYTKLNAKLVSIYHLYREPAPTDQIPSCFIGCPKKEERIAALRQLLQDVNGFINASEQETDTKVFPIENAVKWIDKTADSIANSISKPASSQKSVLSEWIRPNIYQRWEQKWKHGVSDDYDFFFQFFASTYYTVSQRALYQKNCNFSKKARIISTIRLFGVIDLLLLGGYLLLCGLCPQFSFDIASLLAFETAFILLSILIVFPSIKELDVAKHQETWARHRFQADKMEIEMVKYICQLTPYHGGDRQSLFMSNILATEEDTMNTFLSLMTQQEKGLLDELTNLK